MPALTSREKRTLRIATIAVSVYLLLFFGLQGWKYFDKKRAGYRQLVNDAQNLAREVKPYGDKAVALRKLMEGFALDPARLTSATVVAQASAAIQKAAMGGGLQVGPVRESPARQGNKELGSLQLEASGPAPALLKFLHQTESLGFPLVIESLQIGSEPSRPGQVKLNLTISILDFEQWEKEASHA